MPVKSAAEWAERLNEYQRKFGGGINAEAIEMVQAEAVRWAAEQQREAIALRAAKELAEGDLWFAGFARETPLVTLPKEGK